MGRTKDPRYDFLPGLDKALMVGDVLYSRQSGNVLTIVGKRYQDDMTIAYLVRSTGRKKWLWVQETSLLRPAGGGTERIRKAPRKIICEEKQYTGVFFGSSAGSEPSDTL